MRLGASRAAALAVSLVALACSRPTEKPKPGPSASPPPSAEPAKPSVIAPDPFVRFPKEFQATSMRGSATKPVFIDGNSIEALEAAHKQGIRFVEVDFWLTSDSVFLSSHDRGSKRCGLVADLTAKRAKACALEGNRHMATLEELLALPFDGIFLDLKDTKSKDDDRVATVVQGAANAVRKAGREKDVVLMVYRAPAAAVGLVRERGLRAGMKGYPESPADTDALGDQAARHGFEMVCVNAKHVTPEVIRRAARRGVWHLPWSIESSKVGDWQELVAAGAGGFISHHYDLMVAEVAGHWKDARRLTNRR